MEEEAPPRTKNGPSEKIRRPVVALRGILETPGFPPRAKGVREKPAP